MAERLSALGARFVQANVQDGLALQDALQIWLDSANDELRKPFDKAISAAT